MQVWFSPNCMNVHTCMQVSQCDPVSHLSNGLKRCLVERLLYRIAYISAACIWFETSVSTISSPAGGPTVLAQHYAMQECRTSRYTDEWWNSWADAMLTCVQVLHGTPPPSHFHDIRLPLMVYAPQWPPYGSISFTLASVEMPQSGGQYCITIRCKLYYLTMSCQRISSFVQQMRVGQFA